MANNDSLEVDFLGIEDVGEDTTVGTPAELEVEETPNLEEVVEETEVTPEVEQQEEETPAEDIPLTQELISQLGFEFEEEFEDSVEGITQLTRAAASKMANQQLDEIFEQYPEVKELFEYRTLGGDPDKYYQTKFPEVDFTTVEFTDNEQQHEQLVRAELQNKGYSLEEIQAELEDYKAGGILESKAKRALESLKKYQVAQKEKLIATQREQYENEQREIQKFWEGINDTVTKTNQLKGFKLPESDKKAFFDYISRPVKDGMSQRDLDVNESDIETRLAIDYLLYKKFNLSNLVTNRASTQRAQSLRERLKRGSVSGTPMRRVNGVEEIADL
jgi:DNA-binding transcriptional MerR regulator